MIADDIGNKMAIMLIVKIYEIILSSKMKILILAM